MVGEAQRSYDNTVVKSGAHAHLGDSIHEVKVNGGIHIHYHDVRGQQTLRDELQSTSDQAA